MAHKFKVLYDAKNKNASIAESARINADGNLIIRLRMLRGMHRIYFEVDRGTFDPDFMFFNVYGTRIGPSTQFFRVPGMTDATPKTRYRKDSFVCPMVDVYLDSNFISSSLTDFPSPREFAQGLHYGEFALELEGRTHELKLVNGRDYHLIFKKVLIRPDERVPRKHISIKEGLKNNHPRLFFTPDGIKELKIKAVASHRERWEELKQSVDERLAQLEALKSGKNVKEAPWQKQREADAADVLPFALVYLISGERKYYEVALQGVERLLTTQLPGPKHGERMRRGYEFTEPGTLIEIASCFYDWCYPELDPFLRDMIRSLVGQIMKWWFDFIKFDTLEWPGNPGGMEHSAYNWHAVGIAGLTFVGEIPEAQDWLDWSVRHFDIARERTPQDGSLGLFPKEHCFHCYFNFAAALYHSTGINQLKDWPFFLNYPDYRIRKETSNMENFPSGYQTDYSANMIAFEGLAALTRNPRAQWLAERYRAKARDITRLGARHGKNLPHIMKTWRFLLYDPTVSPEVDFKEMSLDYNFKGSGLALLRSGWFNPGTIHAALHSGTTIGEKVLDLEYRVASVSNPCANMVALYGYGEFLLGNTIYTYCLFTSSFSTLTIDGMGQIEDKTVCGCRKKVEQAGRIVDFYAAEKFSYVAAEAGQCYEKEVGVRKFRRHVLFCKPDLALVMDEVELEKLSPAEIHFVFNIQEPTTVLEKLPAKTLKIIAKNQALFIGRNAGCLLTVPFALQQQLSLNDCPVARGYTDKDSLYRRVTVAGKKTKNHRFLTLLSPLAKKSINHPPRITEKAGKDAISWTIEHNGENLSVLMPLAPAGISRDGISFAGKLLVMKDKEFFQAIGARTLELSGLKKIVSAKWKNIGGVWNGKNWQMKSWWG